MTPASCLARRVHAGRGFTVVELLVVVAIIGVLLGLLLPVVQASREVARRATCLNNLRQVGFALLHHQSARGTFPLNLSGTGIRHHWVALILPYIDENPLVARYDFRVRFDDARNREAVQTPLAFMSCPSTPGGPLQHSRFVTSAPTWWASAADYAGSDGPSSTLWSAPAVVSFPQPANIDGMFTGNATSAATGRRLLEISDGLSKSIAVVECAGRPRIWAFGRMVPGSGEFNSTPLATMYASLCGWADTNVFAVRGFRQDPTQAAPANQYKSPGPQIVNGSNNWGIHGLHPGGACVSFADASVRFLDAAVSADVVAAQLTIRAGDATGGP